MNLYQECMSEDILTVTTTLHVRTDWVGETDEN